MQENKKRKILIGTLVPTVLLSTTVLTTAVVFSLRNETTLKKDYTIKFNAGEGQFANNQSKSTEVYAGTKFEQIDQPIVECKDKTFTGWYDQNHNLILPRQTISTNLTLTAGYTASTGSYVKLRFIPGDSGATIQGNTSVSVTSGYHFFMVNRPNVKKEGCYLKGWVYQNGSKAGQDVLENDYMTENVTLVPKLTSAATVTWHGNGAIKTRGSDVTYVQTGATFGSVNQPSFEYGTSLFQGWYKDAECTTPWNSSDLVTENTDAYAKWEDTPSQYFCTINYTQRPGTTIVPTFSPSTSQAVLKTTPWSAVFKPTVTTALGEYSVDYWEYSLDGSTNWQTITPDQTFNLDSVYIAPHLTPDAYLLISGNDNIYTSSNSAAYTADVFPATLKVLTSEWEVVSWSGTSATTPTIDSNGVITTLNGTGILTIRADILLEAGKALTQTKTITVYDPTIASSDYWTLDGSGWVKLDASTLTDPDATNITGVKADGTSYSMARSSFNSKVTIGGNVTSIPDDFLANCPALTYAPEFISSAVKTIGNGFMYGCSNMNEAITIPNSVTSIGNDFLANCSSFNSALTLSNALVNIGSQFLMNCTSFNVDLTLPTSLESVGSYFMINNDAFINTLTINCSGDVFDQGDIYSFSTSNSNALHYKTGAIVTGDGSEGFKNLYKPADGEYLGESDIYRKYRNA